MTWEIKIHKLFFFLPKFLLSQIHTIWKSQLCNYFDPFCYHTIFHYEPREQAVLLGELRCWGPCVIISPTLYLIAAGKIKKVEEISRENMSFLVNREVFTHNVKHFQEEKSWRLRILALYPSFYSLTFIQYRSFWP